MGQGHSAAMTSPVGPLRSCPLAELAVGSLASSLPFLGLGAPLSIKKVDWDPPLLMASLSILLPKLQVWEQ